MDRQEITSELENIIGDYLKNQGLNLVELILRHEGRDLVLRVLVDRPEGGITLGECAGINAEISNLLYEKDILQAGHTLEVSSPGLDRPLKTKNDFSRCVRRKVRLFLNFPINGKIELEGTINSVGEESVYIESKGEVIEIPLAKINKAKQIIE